MSEPNPNTIAPDCICNTYDTNPPDDPRLPALHKALHHAQQAFQAIVAAQQPNSKATLDDYDHYSKDSKDWLASAAQRIDRTITLVEQRRI